MIVSSKLIKRKKLYGFDGEKSHQFIQIRFRNEAAMRKVKGLWYDASVSDTGEYRRLLKPNGYEYDGVGTILYEAQIPPLLRLFHIKEISPSGWVALPHQKIKKNEVKKTSCDYEYIIKFADLISLPKKETVVPYKICSFDIEASSSHGDFPLPVKNYKKLATNITDLFINRDDAAKEDRIQNTAFIKDIILSAFGLLSSKNDDDLKNIINNVDKVFPIKTKNKKITKESIEGLFEEWIRICPAQYKNAEGSEIEKLLSSISDIEGGGGGDEEDEEAGEGGSEDGCEEEEGEGVKWWKTQKPKLYFQNCKAIM